MRCPAGWEWAASLLMALLLAVLSYVALGYPLVGIDDANIFFAYAKRITAGSGIVYYGGGEHVEGFTSPLWLLICVIVEALAPGWREELLLAVAVAMVAATLAGLLGFIRKDLGGDASPRLVMAGQVALLGWVLLTPAYGIWSTVPLMETALWGMVLSLGTIAVARSDPQKRSSWRQCPLGVWVAIGLVTRPEALLVSLVWIAARVHVLAREAGLRAAARATVFPIAIYLGVAAGLTLLRLWYFGQPLPNTFYAKVSRDPLDNVASGIDDLVTFFRSHPLAVLGLAAVVVLTARFLRASARSNPEKTEAAGFVVAVSTMTALAIPLIEGGDHFAFHRQLQPVWPLLGVTILAGLLSLGPVRALASWSTLSGRAALCGVTLIALYAANVPRWDAFFRPNPSESIGQMRFEFQLASVGRELGRALNELSDGALPSIGVITAGGIAVTYRGPIIDLLGLNNVRMAHATRDRKGMIGHSAFDERVFYELSPDVVVPQLAKSGNRLATAKSRLLDPSRLRNQLLLKGLITSPRFRDLYLPVAMPLRGPREGTFLVAWVKAAILSRFDPTGATVLR